MREHYLPFSPPLIGEEEIAEVVDSLRSGWITTGPKTKRFEEEFARFVGAPAALAVSSGTDAMLVGLAALGVRPGDEVITSTLTFCSTAHVIEHVGARPVLVDVEPETLNIDPEQVARATTARTRALMPVHLYGHPCEMDALVSIARERQLHIVEDSAHSLPARYRGQLVGTPWDLGAASDGAGSRRPLSLAAFSFYATKNLTTAEGGMLTGDAETIERARIWSLHGMSRDAYQRYTNNGSWRYEVVLPGFKCNMTDIQAALGLAQLRKLPSFHERRREMVCRYREALSTLDAVELPVERGHVESAWHLFVIRLRLEMLRIDRAQFIEEMKARNIGTSVHFIPLHVQPHYRNRYGCRPEDFPVAHREYQRLVTLPLNLTMSDQDLDDVVEAVADIVRRYRR